MKTSILTLLFLALVGITLAQQIDLSSCISSNWVGCAGAFATSIFKLHRWSDNTRFNVGPYACVGNFKGRISKWKWKWDGRVSCPTLANIQGTSSGFKSRNGAIEHALADLMNKLKAGNYLTQEQWATIANSMKKP